MTTRPGEDAPATSSSSAPTTEHWERIYRADDSGDGSELSWFQSDPQPSLRMIGATGAGTGRPVVDVGGGASRLAGALLARGYTDLIVLDRSAAALRIAQRALRAEASRIHWRIGDLRDWRPDDPVAVWHDRAVLHFFTEQADRESYLRTLSEATEPGSHAVLATFAPDGPTHCSGLPVCRYDSDGLNALLGRDWQLRHAERQLHRTPAGGAQAFSWTVFRRAR